MFQRFLQNQERQREVQIIRDLQANMQTLNQLVTYLTEEKQSSDESIREILRSNHPIFSELRKLLRVPYGVFFTTRAEMSEWLAVRQFTPVPTGDWDAHNAEEWIMDDKADPKMYSLLKIASGVFDENGGLVVYTAQQWNKDWVSLTTHRLPQEELAVGDSAGITDDDVPF